jgi:colanic acid biosynthesis glycosyl transferase WcaI
MKIVLLSSAYGKGGAATNQLWTELCEHFAGVHSVTVLTAAWHLATPEFRKENAVEILSIAAWGLPRIKNRHLWEAALWLLMAWKVLQLKEKFDLVICVDTPRFSVVPGWLAKWKCQGKLVAWVMDLPLEQVVRREKAEAKFSARIAATLNRLYFWSLLICDRVVVLGDCMRQVMKNHGIEKTSVIGPWAEHPQPSMRVSPADARKENGYPEKFTIAYFGYAGEWHDFDAILKAIQKLTANRSVQFVFAGLGPGIDRVAAEKEKNGWEGVLVKGWVPRGELGSLPSCADLHLVSLKQKMLGTCVPSKTYGALAYGRPVIFLGPKECQAAMDILQADAGCVVQNAEELVAAVEAFVADPEKLEQASRNARKAFLEKHQASAVFKKWDELIEEAVGGGAAED